MSKESQEKNRIFFASHPNIKIRNTFPGYIGISPIAIEQLDFYLFGIYSLLAITGSKTYKELKLLTGNCNFQSELEDLLNSKWVDCEVIL